MAKAIGVIDHLDFKDATVYILEPRNQLQSFKTTVWPLIIQWQKIEGN